MSTKNIRKRMTKKQRDKCSSRVSAALRKTGSTYPDDDFEATATSGKESAAEANDCCHRKKVKSGAEVKKRQVKKQDLWPHTISNEEGKDVDSENISLANFFSSFTSILLEAKGEETGGENTTAQCNMYHLKISPMVRCQVVSQHHNA